MNKKSIFLIIGLFLVAIGVLVYSTFFANKEEENKNDIKIVTNYSEFYTVNSCLYRVITYLHSSDSDTMLLLLPDKYKKSNKINKSNVLDQFTKVTEDSTFTSKKMYYQKVNDNIKKYYVYGTIDANNFLQSSSVFNSNLWYRVIISISGRKGGKGIKLRRC